VRGKKRPPKREKEESWSKKLKMQPAGGIGHHRRRQRPDHFIRSNRWKHKQGGERNDIGAQLNPGKMGDLLDPEEQLGSFNRKKIPCSYVLERKRRAQIGNHHYSLVSLYRGDGKFSSRMKKAGARKTSTSSPEMNYKERITINSLKADNTGKREKRSSTLNVATSRSVRIKKNIRQR